MFSFSFSYLSLLSECTYNNGHPFLDVCYYFIDASKHNKTWNPKRICTESNLELFDEPFHNKTAIFQFLYNTHFLTSDYIVDRFKILLFCFIS